MVPDTVALPDRDLARGEALDRIVAERAGDRGSIVQQAHARTSTCR